MDWDTVNVSNNYASSVAASDRLGVQLQFMLVTGAVPYGTVRPQGRDRGELFAMCTETSGVWPARMRQTIRTFFASGSAAETLNP